MKPEPELFPCPSRSSDLLPPTMPQQNHGKVGDAASDARAAAVAARTTAWQAYTAANTVLGDDVSRYNGDISTWNAEAPTMPNPDYNDCFNLLAQAHDALTPESDNVNSGYNHVGAGDTDFTNGDNSQNPMQKTMLYNSAKAHYDACTTAAGTAGTNHTAVDTKLDAAEVILARHGP